MVELDVRKFGMREVAAGASSVSCGALTQRYWYHFVSLIAIVVFMVLGFSPILSVFWATVVTFAVSLPPTRHGDGAAQARRRAEGRLGADAERRGDLRRGRHHRRRRREDRPRAQVQRDRHRLRRRQPVRSPRSTRR